MARHRAHRRGQSGQMLVLFALMLPVIIGFVGLVIDVGFTQAHKRRVQNAADAAALAVARQLAANTRTGIADAAVSGTIGTMVAANGGGTVAESFYLNPDGGTVRAVGTGVNVPAVASGAIPAISGVRVVVTRDVPTFFLPVLGIDTFTVGATASAQYGTSETLTIEPPGGAPVLPINFSEETYNAAVRCVGYGGLTTSYSRDIDETFDCLTRNGGFNWGPLNITGANTNAIIKDLLEIPSPYANNRIRLGETIQVSPGTREVDYRMLDDKYRGQDVLVPIVGDVSRCPNCSVPLIGFRYFHVVRAVGGDSPKFIEGWWVDPRTKPPVPGGGVAPAERILIGPTSTALTR